MNRTSPRRPVRAWITLACALASAGCGLESRRGPAAAAPAAGACMFEPVAVELHPLTRLVRREGGVVIDAHVAMRDAAGDEVKGAGRLVLELYIESGPVEGIGERVQARRWETDLTDAASNSRAYDRVTRTYRFELTGVPETATPGDLTLRAVFRRTDGRQMTAERSLEAASR